MATPPAPGIYTPIPTFFKKDDLFTLDLESQVNHSRYLQHNGIKGIVVMGSTGEQAHLTRKERHLVVSTLHKALPDFPILGGVAANSYQDAIDEITSLKEAGASYALVLPSSYFGPGIKQKGLIEWYTKVADSSPLPLLVYVYPGVTNNVYVDPQTIVTLSKHPNIVGTKISHGDVHHYIIVGLNEKIYSGENNFNFFTGLGQLLLPTLTVGAKGAIDALSGAFPKIYVQLFNAFQKGDLELVKKLQLTITKGEELVVKFGVIGIKKAIHLQGFGETYLGRAPLNQDLEPGQWESIEAFYNELKSLDTSSISF